jgi:hypothetical protein
VETGPLPVAPRLSFCIVTRSASGRVASILELVRPVADELVVAIDDRADDAEIAALGRLADVLRVFTYADPADSATPWLYSLCSGEWILNLDHDEIPSLELLAALPSLVAAADVTHYHLAKRWLWGDSGHALDEPPWGRETAPRLVRNDPASLRFSDEFHRPFVLEGASRYVEAPLWHVDFLLRSFEDRRAKALEYERTRRGLRIAGLAFNAGWYLPELRGGLRTAELPAAERELVERVLAATPPEPPEPPWPEPVRSSGEDLERLWPGAAVELRGRLEPVERVERLTAGVQQTIDVRAFNDGHRVWGAGKEARPELRIAYRWHGASSDERALRTPFPADLAPGESQLVPVHVVPPARPGRHRLELDLVHEHVRWLGAGFELDVEVVPRRRVALIGAGAALEAELDRLQLEPELEPVIVDRGEESVPSAWEHPRMPGARDYLLHGLDGAARARLLPALAARTEALVRRARRPGKRLGHGADGLLAGLAGCERLVVVSPDWPADEPLTRELWRIAATVRAASTLGLGVELRPGALGEPLRRLDRALVADVRRHAL